MCAERTSIDVPPASTAPGGRTRSLLLRRDDAAGLERVAQYIIRNPFSEQKMVYNAENGTVIYRSRMHAKTKRNFEIFSAEEFIAAITQHIPDKGFQMVRRSFPGLRH